LLEIFRRGQNFNVFQFFPPNATDEASIFLALTSTNSGSESNRRIQLTNACNIQRITGAINLNAKTGTVDINVRRSGVTVRTVVIPAGLTGVFRDALSNTPFAADGFLSCNIDRTGSGAGLNFNPHSVNFEAFY